VPAAFGWCGVNAQEKFEAEHNPSARPGLRDWWEIAFDYYDECVELVEEVKAGEEREMVFLRRVKTLTEALEVQKSYSLSLYRQLEKSHGEGDDLRAQLALWEQKRTLGGPAKPYTPDWSANAKLNGNRPPPYTPKDKS